MTGRSRRVVLRRQPLSARRWWSLAVICTAMVVLTGLSIGYTAYADQERAAAEQRARAELAAQEREADRRWCLLLTTLNRAYIDNPPASLTGQQVASAMADLVQLIGCPPR